jgi:hypothetical protein
MQGSYSKYQHTRTGVGEKLFRQLLYATSIVVVRIHWDDVTLQSVIPGPWRHCTIGGIWPVGTERPSKGRVWWVAGLRHVVDISLKHLDGCCRVGSVIIREGLDPSPVDVLAVGLHSTAQHAQHSTAWAAQEVGRSARQGHVTWSKTDAS